MSTQKNSISYPLLCHSLVANAQNKWDLKRSVEYALANNISVKQQDIQARLAELTHYQSRFGRLPSANIGTSLGITTGRSIDRTTNLFTTQSVFQPALIFKHLLICLIFSANKIQSQGTGMRQKLQGPALIKSRMILP